MTRLFFCQNDSLMVESLWQKYSLVTHIFFDLCLFKHFNPVANLCISLYDFDLQFSRGFETWLFFFTFSAHIARLCSVQNKILTSTLQAYIPNLLGILMIFPHLEWDQVMRSPCKGWTMKKRKNWEFDLKILIFTGSVIANCFFF